MRDGEQTPGVALTVDEKIRIAEALDELGVDVIEAGFPITSKGEFEAVKKISGLGLNAKICALARTNVKDIELALDADVDRIHVFIATSDIHLKYKLGITREEALRRALESIEYLRSHGVEIEFSAEDATRSDLGFLKQIYSAVAEAGAHYLNIPDTVGTATPERMTMLVREIASVSRGKVVSVHCHNDFGLATANSVAGILAGAGQVHVTVNGIGERAGNASLEEVVMTLKILYGYELGIRTEKLMEISRLVSRLTGVPVQPNKAIVGRNAFGHESGIHTHGILMNPATYEPFQPELVGGRRWLAVGKHAGSHGIRARLKELGFEVSEEQLKLVIERIKSLGDMGKRVTDKDLVEIAEEILGQGSKSNRFTELLEVSVTSTKANTRSIVKIYIDGNTYELHGEGRGVIDSIINAISKICVLEDIKIKDYSLNIVQIDGGIGVEATAVLETGQGFQVTASSIRPDPHWAMAEAVSEAINMILMRRRI